MRPTPRRPWIPLGAALRLARRDATRARGRSLLVVAMIALPVLGLTTADVLARTAQLSPTEELTRELGAADAAIFYSGGGPVQQDPSGHNSASAPMQSGASPPTQPSEVELLRVLPPTTRLLADSAGRAVPVRTVDGLAIVQLRGFDYADPAAHGLVRQLSGRAPRTTAEVALTRRLAQTLGLHVGDALHTRRPDRTMAVVGIVADRFDVRDEWAYVLPGAVPPGPDERSAARPARYLVDAPGDVTWADVQRLNALGFTVRSRSVVLHPPPRSQVPYYANPAGQGGSVGTQVVAAGVLAVGMALLEVVLLAGPAFAVGARRRRRDLALVAASGGDGRDVRNVVLGGGVVLGTAAAVAGVALGTGVAAALRPVLERVSGTAMGHFDVRLLELAGVAAVGLLTGLAAALLPARSAARQDVVAALAGRRGVVVNRKRVPLVGLAIAVLGAVVATWGAGSHGVAVILAGAVLGEIGLIACTPTVLAVAGGLGRRLPLCPRMALRDAARSRASAAPAVAAVMAAVAGSVAIGVYTASLSRHDELTYHPSLAYGAAAVPLADSSARDSADEIASALRRALPARRVVVVQGRPEDVGSAGVSVEPTGAQRCPAAALTAATEADYRRYAEDPRCRPRSRYVGVGVLPSVLVDDGTALPLLTGTAATTAVTALRAGKAVVFDDYLVADGHTTVRIESGGGGTARAVPAVVQRSGFAPAQIVLPPALASRLGVRVAPVGVLADDVRPPTVKEEQAARGALALAGTSSYLLVERGYRSAYDVGLLVLAIGAGVITLGAAGIATALSNEDGRADLSTLAAVGASPRVRRMLSMSRSGVIAGLGTALGVGAGFVPAVGLILAQRRVDGMASLSNLSNGIAPRPLVIPWSMLALTAFVVPLIAVAVAGAFSRSRLPVERIAPR